MLEQAGRGERVAVEVVVGRDIVLVHEQPRERGGNEAGPTGDEDALAVQSHGAHSSLRSVHDFVEQIWRLVLRREPDPDTLGRVERGEVSRTRVVRELVASREFELVELLDDGLARARLERARGGRP